MENKTLTQKDHEQWQEAIRLHHLNVRYKDSLLSMMWMLESDRRVKSFSWKILLFAACIFAYMTGHEV